MQIEKVLLVDDEEDIRTIGELCLANVGGWTVLLAASGEEAIETAHEQQPDVILLDAMMPGMDGPTTFARLRDSKQTAAIPVIFITARVQKAEVDRYLGLGAAGVIAKPFDPMELPSRIREIAEAR